MNLRKKKPNKSNDHPTKLFTGKNNFRENNPNLIEWTTTRLFFKTEITVPLFTSYKLSLDILEAYLPIVFEHRWIMKFSNSYLFERKKNVIYI